MTRRTNIFAGPYPDRRGYNRGDPAWLEREINRRHARFLPVQQARNLVSRDDPPGAVFLTQSQSERYLRRPDSLIFLGNFREYTCFAFEVDDEPGTDLVPDSQFADLHRIGSLLAEDEASLLAYARGMVLWHAAHRYCGHCGHPSYISEGGHVRCCSNKSCGQQTFPRVDPAIIVLVENGQRCLLGRQKDWPAGRYSTIAGFVEPGESLEDAVAREVMEETGVEVDRIRYHSSQPWPFPSSLMLGFTATAGTTEINLKDGELENARWFEPDDFLNRGFRMPNRVSIARRLVEGWLSRQKADLDHH